MKKIIALILAIIVMNILFLSSCSNRGKGDDIKKEKQKIGIGVLVENDISESEDDGSSDSKIIYTVAAVIIDENKRVSEVMFDAAECSYSVSSKGKFSADSDFKTKRELGDSYIMSSENGKLKWYQQADAYAKELKGKTLDEARATVAENGKGNDKLISAGCTISVSEFAKALELAFANANDVPEYKSGELGIGVFSEISGSDAGESDGKAELESSFVATLKSQGKVIAQMSDAIDITQRFDANGKIKDDSAEYKTKRTLGDRYGMISSGIDNNGDGKMLEWYLQANELDRAVVGKTKSEILGMNIDGYANETIQSAGCTIRIDGLSRAAAKALG